MGWGLGYAAVVGRWNKYKHVETKLDIKYRCSTVCVGVRAEVSVLSVALQWGKKKKRNLNKHLANHYLSENLDFVILFEIDLFDIEVKMRNFKSEELNACYGYVDDNHEMFYVLYTPYNSWNMALDCFWLYTGRWSYQFEV